MTTREIKVGDRVEIIKLDSMDEDIIFMGGVYTVHGVVYEDGSDRICGLDIEIEDTTLGFTTWFIGAEQYKAEGALFNQEEKETNQTKHWTKDDEFREATYQSALAQLEHNLSVIQDLGGAKASASALASAEQRTALTGIPYRDLDALIAIGYDLGVIAHHYRQLGEESLIKAIRDKEFNKA